jgi:hypothetical protein
MIQPYGIYDKRVCHLIHIGLYDSPQRCWETYLGWPSPEEIKEAQANGLICVSITCTYDPYKDASLCLTLPSP